MKGDLGRDEAAALEGSLLRLSEAREIAIYRRDGVAWVADFRGGRGELFTAGEWFALNGRASALRRAESKSAAPLPVRVIERIERLHESVKQTKPESPSGEISPTRLLATLRRLVVHSFGAV